MYDFIIIGAGFGGLSTAALLAKKGKKVLLLEASSFPGGRAFYHEKEGFVWQYGQHSHRLGEGGFAAEVMRRLGQKLEFYRAPKGKSKIFYRGRLFDRPEGPLGFLTTQALSFSARLRFLRFYAYLLGLDANSYYDVTLRDLYRSRMKPDEELEGFLNFLGFTIMLPDSSLVSAGEVIDFLQRVKRAPVPVADTPGGSKQIIDALTAAIARFGGEMRFGEKAASIIVEHSSAAGVVTASGELRSRAVVYAAPVGGVLSLVSPSLFDDEFISYVRGLRHSSAVVIDFVSRAPLADFSGGILGVDEPLWVKFQTLFDSTVAPPGFHVCSWGLLTAWDKGDDPGEIARTEKRLRDIASICMPGFESAVVRERKLVIPMVNANILIPSQSRPHRPGVMSKHVQNLYFAGDTVSAGGCSGDIAFDSACKIDDLIS
jgi:phytoene dehydrogenase-like protein